MEETKAKHAHGNSEKEHDNISQEPSSSATPVTRREVEEVLVMVQDVERRLKDILQRMDGAPCVSTVDHPPVSHIDVPVAQTTSNDVANGRLSHCITIV